MPHFIVEVDQHCQEYVDDLCSRHPMFINLWTAILWMLKTNPKIAATPIDSEESGYYAFINPALAQGIPRFGVRFSLTQTHVRVISCRELI